MTTRKVRVDNNTGKDIYVTISDERKHLVESQDKSSISVDLSSSIGFEEIEASHSTGISKSDKTVRKYEWSPFIQAGEILIPQGSYNIFTIHTDKEIYYLTVRVNKVSPCINIGMDKSEVTIGPKGIPTVPGQIAIHSEQTIYLKHKETEKFIQDPVRSDNLPCGNVGNAPGKHLLIYGSKDDTINNSVDLRIRCENDTSAGDDCRDYNNLYSSDKGWIYYDQASDNKKQIWTIYKTSNPSNSKGSAVCFEDEVVFRNKNWNSSKLYIHNNDHWLACNKYDAEWIISTPRY